MSSFSKNGAELWKLIAYIVVAAFALYYERGVILFFALAGLVSWPVFWYASRNKRNSDGE